MPPFPRHAALPLCAGLGLFLAAATAGAADRSKATSPAPDAAVIALDGRAVVATADGGAVVLPPIADGRFETAAPVTGGWAAAGTREGDLVLVVPGRQIPPPPGRTGTRRRPLLLVAKGRLEGIAWLEGDDPRRLAVRFAAWSGTAWGPAQVVSPPGPGSQLALSGDVLADGTFLLAWSAFDGEDDEIRWSVRRKETWTTPARAAADNRVPDITPSVLALPSSTGRGAALLAWSRFDGRAYETVVARYAFGRLGEPRRVGSAGTLYPRFAGQAAGRVRLLLRLPVPRGWEALELDGEGRPRRRAVVFSDGDARSAPLLDAGAGGYDVIFRWPASGAKAVRLWENLP